MSDSNEDGGVRERRAPSRSGGSGVRVALLVLGLVIVAGVGYLIATGTWFGDSTSTDVTVAEGESVSDSDEVVIEIPQNPSLKLVSEGGTWNVENDGNVTLSEVEVRDTTGAIICEIGEMAPGDLEPCEDAGDRQDLVVVGNGPQGQKVEEPAPAG